ncbi:uncharacterized protein PSFLO_06769 [Pseudozyma flocculosa]|uniref:Uncharacterized protein n=1 Tax=Pseudozyma flocculosa TaxID=84751 RepID=A0A5C3FCD4_9BASI|nr:uncharacterized protein PSFLO_06769 [Pseudozyma flocculosa]
MKFTTSLQAVVAGALAVVALGSTRVAATNEPTSLFWIMQVPGEDARTPSKTTPEILSLQYISGQAVLCFPRPFALVERPDDSTPYPGTPLNLEVGSDGIVSVVTQSACGFGSCVFGGMRDYGIRGSTQHCRFGKMPVSIYARSGGQQDIVNTMEAFVDMPEVALSGEQLLAPPLPRTHAVPGATSRVGSSRAVSVFGRRVALWPLGLAQCTAPHALDAAQRP